MARRTEQKMFIAEKKFVRHSLYWLKLKDSKESAWSDHLQTSNLINSNIGYSDTTQIIIQVYIKGG